MRTTFSEWRVARRHARQQAADLAEAEAIVRSLVEAFAGGAHTCAAFEAVGAEVGIDAGAVRRFFYRERARVSRAELALLRAAHLPAMRRAVERSEERTRRLQARLEEVARRAAETDQGQPPRGVLAAPGPAVCVAN
jgi:hypothetical protein